MLIRWMGEIARIIGAGHSLRRRARSADRGLRFAVSTEALEQRQLLVANGIELITVPDIETAGLMGGIDPDVDLEDLVPDSSLDTQNDSLSAPKARHAKAHRADRFVSRILNGSTTIDSVFAAVGIVGSKRDLNGFGTGTLIDDDWVLTAGHVSRGVGRNAGRFIVGGVTYETERIYKHPQFRLSKLGTDQANDIALWKLRTPVSGITPSLIDRVVPQVGETLTLVGFGSGGTEAGEFGDFGIKRQGSTPIDQVSATLISWDFDHPDESNTGHGDSGGPAYIERSGIEYIAGVTSGGEKANAALGDHSYDTRVQSYTSWIDQILAGEGRNRRIAGQSRIENDATVTRARESRSVIPRIVNGTPIPDSTFASVGKASSILGPCTATLISPEWILTAGHCSQGLGPTSGTFELNGETYQTTQVVVHPKYKSFKLGTNAANDLALWKLDRPVTGVTPSPLIQKVSKVGTNLTLVGFGLGGDSAGATGEYGTKRQGQTRLDSRTGKLLRWKFDSPSESNTAAGDSGGPAFVLVGGVYYLAGVTSGGRKADSSLGDEAVDTRVDAYDKWINSVIQA